MDRDYGLEEREQAYGEGFNDGYVEAMELLIIEMQEKLKKFKGGDKVE